MRLQTIAIAAVLLLAVASTTSLGYTPGTYISWEIEQYTGGRWKEIRVVPYATHAEPHPELESLFPGCGSRRQEFRSGAYNITPTIGKRYRIKVRNKTSCRLAVTVAVDGVNSVDSETVRGRSRDSSWVLDGGRSVVIKGFQSGWTKAKEFYWTVSENAYSDNYYRIGNIELFVYLEDTPCARREFEGWQHESRSLARPSAPDTGTGAGDDVHNPVVAVNFRELTEKPVEAVRVGYSRRGYTYTTPPRLDDQYYYYVPAPQPDPYPYWNRRWDEKKDCFPGIGVYGNLSSSGGALINGVIFDGPAYRAGVRGGDKIVSVNGGHVGSFYDLKELISRAELGDYVALGYLRFGRYSSAATRIEMICPP